MKKAPARRPAPKKKPAAKSAAKPAKAAKTSVKRVAKRAVRMTERSATKALAELKTTVTALKRSKAAQAGEDTVKAALKVATKLNRVVKGMKSAKLI